MDIEVFDNYLERWELELKSSNTGAINRDTIFDALVLLFGDEIELYHPVDIWSLEISFEVGLSALKSFDFETFERIVTIELEFNPDELFQTKVRFKSKGLNIVIHKNDKDPFPSNPHGHIIDQNLKLDLSNGNCFRNRTFVRKIRKKELIQIREIAQSKFHSKLPELEIL